MTTEPCQLLGFADVKTDADLIAWYAQQGQELTLCDAKRAALVRLMVGEGRRDGR